MFAWVRRKWKEALMGGTNDFVAELTGGEVVAFAAVVVVREKPAELPARVVAEEVAAPPSDNHRGGRRVASRPA